MGCDIHMYIEYADKKRENKYWMDFGGRINPGRNYTMFGILAGVRSDEKFSFEPKGVPEVMSYAAAHDNQLYITDDGKGERECTKEQAKRWTQSGSSQYVKAANGENLWVTHPDWHSHSWLSTEEYKKALEFYFTEYNRWSNEPEYQAVLSCLETFEKLGFEARIVFWFDN